MFIQIKSMQYASIAFAAVLLVGCESQTPVGAVPIRVAPTASAPVEQASAGSTATPALPAPPVASGNFSLPIGADISPSTNSDAAGKATLNVTPLADQPEYGQKPQQGQPRHQTPLAASATGGITAPAAVQGQWIHLSAGIAVPQILPIGTVMAISVDYSLRSELKGSSQYFLVVKSAGGEIINEVKLESSGNLSAFFQQLKPEHRPFSVRMEEVSPGSTRRTIISNELPLKTDY